MPLGLRDRRIGTPDLKNKPEVNKKEKVSGPMDKWVEPAVATKASYEDHHGMPYGVLEHMQPLGEAPSAKVRARVKGENTRKSLIGRTTNAQSTPEGTPQPQTRQQAKVEMPSVPQAKTRQPQVKVESPPPPPPPPPAAIVDDTQDGDYAPKIVSKKKERSRAKNKLTTTPAAKAAKPRSSRGLPNLDTEEGVAAVIVHAKKRAISNGTPELADAVQQIYIESRTSPRLKVLLLKVVKQKADPADLDEFQTYVKVARAKLGHSISSYSPTTSTSTQAHEEDIPRRVDSKADETTPSPDVNGRPKSAVKSALARQRSQNHINTKITSAKVHFETVTPKTSTNTASREVTIPKTTTTRSHREVTTQRSSTPKQTSTSKTSTKTVPEITINTSKIISETSNTVQLTPRSKTKRMNDDSEMSELTDFDDEDDDDDDGDEMAIDSPAANGHTEVESATTSLSEEPRGRAAAKKSREASRTSLAIPGNNNNNHHNNLKRNSEDAELTPEPPALKAKKQRLANNIQREYSYEESNVRSVIESRDTGYANTSSESPLSSPALSHRFTPPPVTLKPGPGKRAKTKQSPEKKPAVHTTGALSGLGNATQQSNSPMDINESDAEGSENNDFCSSCAGSGYLLCCDGCDRAFHFKCLDPPLSPDAEELNEPWFCYICVANKRLMGEGQSTDKQTSGLFAPLFTALSKQNPTIFTLPQDVQTFYEGCGPDDDGNFINLPRLGRKKAPGFGEAVDLYKLRDGKGNMLFCYECQETSQGNRQVVQCDECTQLWHLDCLDPPLAIHPCITGDGRKVAEWLCPLHIEHELRHIEARRLFHQQQGRKLRVRKPRGANIQETFLSRGVKNNGIIEISNVDSSDDDSESDFYLEEDPRRDDVILKVPDHGLKLDFIEKIKQTRIQNYRDHNLDTRPIPLQGSRIQRMSIQDGPFSRHSLQDQQTALNLAQFARADSNEDLGLGNDDLETLLASLVAEAPAKVVNGEGLTSSDTLEMKNLLALQQLITRRLDSIRA